MVQVYSEPLSRRYYASRFSCAYLFLFALSAIAIGLPFFLAYTSTPDFWLKADTYVEQPDVEYEYKSLLTLRGTDATGAPLQIFFSTISSVNTLYEKDVRVPLMRSTRIDRNRDGPTADPNPNPRVQTRSLADRHHLEVIMPLAVGESILDASLVCFFNVKLKRRARLDFEALTYATSGSALPGRALWVAGDVLFKQRAPLKAKGGYVLPYENTPLLDPATVSFEQVQLPRLLAASAARNYTAEFVEQYSVWSPSLGASTNSPESYTFNFTLDMRIPPADVEYTPTATEVLKAAWIRYLSLFVVVVYLLDKVAAFIFYNQLFDTTMTVETAESKAGVKRPGF